MQHQTSPEIGVTPSDTYQSATLRRVVTSGLCAGCGGCAAVAPEAISMTVGASGYARPVQLAPVSDQAEAGIDSFCPGVRLDLQACGRHTHPLWGPYVAIRAGHATDPDLRKNASSGGVLSAVLVDLLASGQVDEVVQTAASRQDPIGTETVTSTHARDVFGAAGSRYAPSAPLAQLDQALARGRRIAFVGKPCDVAALRQMAPLDPRIDLQVKVAISFFCAGVPSRKGALRILDALKVDPTEVTAFRYRGDGWPGFATATLKDGTSRRMSYADSWGGILSRYVQKRCKLCPDGTGGFADLVCADAWETDENGYPLFEEREGISLVMTRTGLGEDVLQGAVARGAVSVSDFPVEDISAMQVGQTGKKRWLWARMAALRLLRRPVPEYRGFELGLNARAGGLRANLRQFLGMLWRELRRDA